MRVPENNPENCRLCGGELCTLGAMGNSFLAVHCRHCGAEDLLICCPDCGEPNESRGHMTCAYPCDEEV